MVSTGSSDSVVTIDCKYRMPEFAAAYLIVEGDRAAFVDNNTTHATPLLIEALASRGMSPGQVEYIIITHVHLDHAGGTSALVRKCQNAQVVAHPRAARHVIDPERLIAGAQSVYGEQLFNDLYGRIDPVDADRVRTVDDNETIEFGTRTLTFMHTLGHAKHHMCIHDSGSDSVFSGDSFGLSLPTLQHGQKRFIICSSSPTDFDADEARNAVHRILRTDPQRVYLTHFGVVTAVKEAGEQLIWSIDSMESVLEKAIESGLEGSDLLEFCHAGVRDSFREQATNCGFSLSAQDWHVLDPDLILNAQGISFLTDRHRS